MLQGQLTVNPSQLEQTIIDSRLVRNHMTATQGRFCG